MRCRSESCGEHLQACLSLLSRFSSTLLHDIPEIANRNIDGGDEIDVGRFVLSSELYYLAHALLSLTIVESPNSRTCPRKVDSASAYGAKRSEAIKPRQSSDLGIRIDNHARLSWSGTLPAPWSSLRSFGADETFQRYGSP